MQRFWADGRKVHMRTDEVGRPSYFFISAQAHQVEEIVKSWRVEDSWWEQAVARHYFKLTTKTGYLVLLYQDGIDGKWYLQRLYD